MKAVVVGSGDPPSLELITQELADASLIIAADGGANFLIHTPFIPDYLVGDLDSITPQTLQHYRQIGVPIRRYPTIKDQTDGQIAIDTAHALAVSSLVLLGFLGGPRVDHLLGAIGLLDYSQQYGIKCTLRDNFQTISLLNQSTEIHGQPGQTFSIQAYGAPVENLSLTNSQYPLSNYRLIIGDNRTISNQFTHPPAQITFSAGKILLIIKNGVA